MKRSGDPRLSIEERYPNFFDYYYKVSKAVGDLVAERFMLREDAGVAMNRMLNAGFATGAIKWLKKRESRDCAVKRPPLGGRLLSSGSFSCNAARLHC